MARDDVERPDEPVLLHDRPRARVAVGVPVIDGDHERTGRHRAPCADGFAQGGRGDGAPATGPQRSELGVERLRAYIEVRKSRPWWWILDDPVVHQDGDPGGRGR